MYILVNLQARVNVPGLSSRSLQLGIASKELAIGTKIQVCVCMLDVITFVSSYSGFC